MGRNQSLDQLQHVALYFILFQTCNYPHIKCVTAKDNFTINLCMEYDFLNTQVFLFEIKYQHIGGLLLIKYLHLLIILQVFLLGALS